MRVAIAIAWAALVLLLGAMPGHAQARVALVIGNSGYRNVPALPNPANDAADVAASLARLGFTVRRIINGTSEDMRVALRDFAPQARRSEMAVVFFAGHGIEIGGDNWLIPVDAELKEDIAAEQEAIALRSLVPIVGAASKLGLIILDACRNNPFAARMQRSMPVRAVERGLTRVEPAGSVLVAFAAKEGTTASDGTGRNSPFTAALLRQIETPGLEVNYLFRNVREAVLNATNLRQEPVVYGALPSAEIYFKPGAKPAVAAPLLPVDQARQAWTATHNTTSVAVLEDFIRQFGSTVYGSMARARLEELKKTQVAALPPEQTQMQQYELGRSLQLELKRVGCYEGAMNGEFGVATREALRNFVKHSALSLRVDDLSLDTIKAVRGFDKRVCPLSCPPGERAEGDSCKRVTAAPARVPTGAKKCFSFQGREFCE